MKAPPAHPALCQINTRVWLTAIGAIKANATCERRSPTSPVARSGCKDLMSSASYDRDGSELGSRGLFLDLPQWGYHVFDVSVV
jgi:hypothetical protein